MSLIRVYYLIFYKIRSALKWSNEDGWEDWRALAIVCLLNLFILFQVYIWVTIIFKEVNFDVPYMKISVGIIGLLITFLNYYATLHHGKWEKYAAEFQSFSKRKNIIANWAVFLILIGVTSGLAFAFYQMSLIDWSKYR